MISLSGMGGIRGHGNGSSKRKSRRGRSQLCARPPVRSPEEAIAVLRRELADGIGAIDDGSLLARRFGPRLVRRQQAMAV
jgi:hypothetical protein